MDRVHDHFLLENNSKSNIPTTFHLGPCLFPQSTHSPNIYKKPLGFSKLIPNIALATSRNYKYVPMTSFQHIFATVTSNPVILVPKFSESLSLSYYAFI
jgi:hypothetical protein